MNRGYKFASVSVRQVSIHNVMVRSYVYTTREQRVQKPKYRHKYGKVLHNHLNRQKKRMKKKKSHMYPVNNTLISQKLDAWMSPKRWREAMQIFYYVTERNGRMDDKNYVKLMKVVGVSSGRIDDATEIIEHYLKVTNATRRRHFVMNTYLKCCRGYPHRAYEFFKDHMLKEGIVPDMNTISFLLESYLTRRPRKGNRQDHKKWLKEEERREEFELPRQLVLEEPEPMDLMDLIRELNDFDPFVFTDVGVLRALQKLDVEIVDEYIGSNALPSDISKDELEKHKAEQL
mmetsp:Transcript_8544/g.12600  ORF Transcript_8544/g.12600 Transcript_8544/m.12600 type:complete len:288 (+) Transcript_8544:47-910(+)